MTSDMLAEQLLSLSDRFEADEGEYFYSGVQALVRVVVDRRRRDRALGLNTALFVSGYPGSPLGGLDRELGRAQTFLEAMGIVHTPGLNEDLAMTALMGSQLATGLPRPTVDGVVGVWYGKAPGLDRSMDALRHAAYAGATRLGGALLLVGDDPASKSSTLPSASERILAEAGVAVLYPGSIQEVIDYGVHAVELSRRTGMYTALKMVTPVADGTGTAVVGPGRVTVIGSRDQGPSLVSSHSISPPGSLEVERQLDDRLAAARRYVVDNGLNQITVAPSHPWLTVVAAGYTYHQTMQAFADLGLAAEDLARRGIRVVKLAALYPLDPDEIRTWAVGTEELLVVEEKRPFLESALKEVLYTGPHRPAVWGKTRQGREMIPGHGHLTAARLTEPLHRLLSERIPTSELRPYPPPDWPSPEREAIPPRTAFFCSGCPHPTGLQVPEGSTVGAGIGCHNLVKLLPKRRVGEVSTLTQMGGEGAQWVGIAPFVEPRPFVQNMGDGTFTHSGSLSVRFAVAAGMHMTFKVLYNSAVAMTGGQSPTGMPGVVDLCRSLLAEGATAVTVTTDDPARYRRVRLPSGAKVLDRSRVVEAQEELIRLPGVTVLIHDQACAAETRRLRKAGQAPVPPYRLVINEAVCEGCGDCGAKSACLSLQPVRSEVGRKTSIQQTSCNMDTSCLRGDCPSFMTVRPGRGARARRRDIPQPPHALPQPSLRVDPEHVYLRMPGIGGTGVVTAAQILGVAAGLDGMQVAGVDQTGVSQKAGPVVSEVRIIGPGASTRVGDDGVDVLLAFDLLVAAAPGNLEGLSRERTFIVGSVSPTPTGSMVIDAGLSYPDTRTLTGALEGRAREGGAFWVDAAGATHRLFGDSTTANMFVLGAAYQLGLIPVAAAAIERAIALNGAAVQVNLAAFGWGRHAAAGTEAYAGLMQRAEEPVHLPGGLTDRLAGMALPPELERRVRRRASDLVGYQGASWAARYLDTVAMAWKSECVTGSTAFTEVVAGQLHRVMAYKDEYEVARLLTSPKATEQAEDVAGPGARVSWMLHPPLLRAMGLDRKITFGPWSRPVMTGLARARFLRHTPLDPFGRTRVRRAERRLIQDYEDLCRLLAAHLPAVGSAEAGRIASLVEQVRGFEGVKLANLDRYKAELDSVLALHAQAVGVTSPAEEIQPFIW